MPFCYVGSYQTNGDSEANNNGTKIFYRTYGRGPIKVLMIIGFAGTHDSWHPQIKWLTGTVTPNDDQFMAVDLDAAEVGGDGNSEGRVELDRQTLSIAIRFFKAKTPEQRAAVDLEIHYTKEYLEEYVGPNTRKAILYQEYVKGISTSGMQSNHGFEGQINACWNHKMSQTELELIRSAGFLISVIHGRDDIIAQLYHAKRLAEKLQPSARMIELHGGHLVSHERTEEVNQALSELIKASEKQMIPYDWTNLPTKSSGWVATRISLGSTTTSEAGSKFSFMVDILEKLFLFLSIFGLFVLIFEFLQRGLRCLKPVAAGPALT